MEIARLLRRAGGLLITPGRTWDLQARRDYDDYCAELRVAAAETACMRNLFYEGQRQRAEAIVRGEAPPMFKGPPSVGYRAVSCFSSGDSVCTWQVDPHSGGAPLIHRGVPLRTWIKCAVCGPNVEALGEELLRQTTLSNVVRAMNARALPSPWKLRDGSRYWTSKLIEQILRQPAYCGWWQWSFQGRTFAVAIPELAYWTKDESEQFNASYLHPERARRRIRQHEHLAAGLVACANCHELLVEPVATTPSRKMVASTRRLVCAAHVVERHTPKMECCEHSMNTLLRSFRRRRHRCVARSATDSVTTRGARIPGSPPLKGRSSGARCSEILKLNPSLLRWCGSRRATAKSPSGVGSSSGLLLVRDAQSNSDVICHLRRLLQERFGAAVPSRTSLCCQAA